MKGARRGRPPGSRNVGHGEAGARAALSSYRAQLMTERNSLDARISGIDAALAAMGVSVARGGGGGGSSGVGRTPTGRSYRKGSLKEYIHNVLAHAGGPMAVKDISAGVVDAGYKSANKTLAKSVGIALTTMSGVSKVGRGLFKAG